MIGNLNKTKRQVRFKINGLFYVSAVFCHLQDLQDLRAKFKKKLRSDKQNFLKIILSQQF